MQQFTLLEINNLVKDTLSKHLESSYWIIAEIGELHLNQKGHCYLELVQKEGEKIISKTRATIWSYTYRNLSVWFENMTGQTLRHGITVLFNAVVQYHEVFGLSLNIRDIDANFTLGERAKKRQEVIQKLEKEGVIDLNKQLSLPLVPQRVAVISAPTAAGFGDFMSSLEQNPKGYHFDVTLFSALMQGEGATKSIIEALHRIFKSIEDFDIVVLIRGGGASSDLDCFDTYDLTSHLAQFPIPIITGIGHERDETIADMVAHTRLKTPTAVSEFLIQGMIAFHESVNTYFNNIADMAYRQLETSGRHLEKRAIFLHKLTNDKLTEATRSIDNTLHRMSKFTDSTLHAHQDKLNLLQHNLQNISRTMVTNTSDKLNFLALRLKSLDPEEVLKRGYSLTTHKGIRLQADTILKPGDQIETHLSNRIITSEVKNISKQ